MRIETLSEQRCFGGTQGIYRHESIACAGPMRFSVYRPDVNASSKLPVVYFLAGLTCTEETFMIKAGAQRMAAELGLILVAPDTSPRDTGIADATGDWEFGEGAGFYLDATEPPYASRFRMASYVADELPTLIGANFRADATRSSIFGHSMGGHGALTIALRNPGRYRAVSAFAPIVAPTQVPWGQKAFPRYLGNDAETWKTPINSSIRNCNRSALPLRAATPASRSSCACNKATTTATGSSRPSSPIICAIMR